MRLGKQAGLERWIRLRIFIMVEKIMKDEEVGYCREGLTQQESWRKIDKNLDGAIDTTKEGC
ncbi:MAG: hypothetical protein QXT63_02325 [Thermoplasmata archaeon]